MGGNPRFDLANSRQRLIPPPFQFAGDQPVRRVYRVIPRGSARPNFALWRPRISCSDGAFWHLALVIYWTRGRAVSSNANALVCSGVGLVESVIAALGT